MLYPITFSIPSEKNKILSSLIPGFKNTYTYNTEEEYYKEYNESFFAMTTKKGGWDCLRHYEILANGCIPYFPNIEKCPENTLALLPKDLLIQSNLLYERLKNKRPNEMSVNDRNEYDILNIKLLEYTKLHLTTLRMAEYILEKTGISKFPKILFLSGQTEPDYLRFLTLHGFKKLLGSKCHDYPKVAHNL